jgi:hypothetical protein
MTTAHKRQQAVKIPVSAQFIPVSAEEYRAALDANKYAATLTDATVEQLRAHRCFGLRINGANTGIYYSITPKGEIAGVVNNGSLRNIAATACISHALRNGAYWLDCWDVRGKLPNLYQSLGFSPVYRAEYDVATYGEPHESLKACWRAAGWRDNEPYPAVVYLTFAGKSLPTLN